jgi:hypothetical protein
MDIYYIQKPQRSNNHKKMKRDITGVFLCDGSWLPDMEGVDKKYL